MAFWKRTVESDAERASLAKRGSADDLIDRLRDRIARVDADRVVPPRAHFAPASVAAIEEAERSLDFALPDLLKRVLHEIANGGFGPGNGLLGVRDGATDEHGSALVDLYDSLSATNPDDPGWRWPPFLVPICTWGDSTYSCVDCSQRDAPMVTFDANGYRPGADLAGQLEPQRLTLEAWLRAWVDGADLWNLMFPLDACLDDGRDPR